MILKLYDNYQIKLQIRLTYNFT